jgi:hypothetical protein
MRPEESPWIEAVVLSDRLQDVITGGRPTPTSKSVGLGSWLRLHHGSALHTLYAKARRVMEEKSIWRCHRQQ